MNRARLGYLPGKHLFTRILTTLRQARRYNVGDMRPPNFSFSHLAAACGIAVALGLPAAASAQQSYGQQPSYAQQPTYAQPSPPPYGHQDSIKGTVSAFDGQWIVYMHDDRGYNDHITLHQGTIINPTGIKLLEGMKVTIYGYADGPTFQATRIDVAYSPYSPYYGADGNPAYGDGGYGYYPNAGYGYGYGGSPYGYGYGGYPYGYGYADQYVGLGINWGWGWGWGWPGWGGWGGWGCCGGGYYGGYYPYRGGYYPYRGGYYPYRGGYTRGQINAPVHGTMPGGGHAPVSGSVHAGGGRPPR